MKRVSVKGTIEILAIDLRSWQYGHWQRLLHRFHLHHTTVLYPEDGPVLEWCQWCGLRAARPTTFADAVDSALEATQRSADITRRGLSE